MFHYQQLTLIQVLFLLFFVSDQFGCNLSSQTASTICLMKGGLDSKRGRKKIEKFNFETFLMFCWHLKYDW